MTDGELDCLETEAEGSCQCDTFDVLLLIAEVRRLKAKLAAVEAAVRGCYLALDQNVPHMLAISKALATIEGMFGLLWKPGEERERAEEEGGGDGA